MKPEPHVEFIPFPSATPAEPADPVADEVDEVAAEALDEPIEAAVDDAAAEAAVEEPVEVAPDDAVEEPVEAASDEAVDVTAEHDPSPPADPSPFSVDSSVVSPDRVLAPDEPVVLLAEGETAPTDPEVEVEEFVAESGTTNDPVDSGPGEPIESARSLDSTGPAEEGSSDGGTTTTASDDGAGGEHDDVIDVRGSESSELALDLSDQRHDIVDPHRPAGDHSTAEVHAESVLAARRASGRRVSDQPPALEVPAASDVGGLRRWGISGRMLLVPMTAIVVAVLIALLAIWAMSATTGTARDLSAGTRAASGASELRILLGQVRQSTPPIETDLLRDLGAQSLDVADASDGLVDPARIDDLVAAVDRVVESSRGGSGAVEVRAQAMTATGMVDQVAKRIDSARIKGLDDIEQTRTRAVVAMLVVLLVGSLVLLLLGRAVTQSVVAPLRALGRAMRRFADGDTGARGVEGVDEVGLLARSFNYSASAMGQRIDRLSADAARGAQLRMISDALDLADDEDDVHRITERALGIVAVAHPAELLLHETTSTRLREVAVHPQLGSPGCPVDTSAGCVAMRRAQPVVFESPSAINACPHLRSRDTACSAACVPVGVNGHLLGVLHVTAPDHRPPGPEKVEQLVTLAGQIGNRIGAMRTLEVTRLQASTDGLTGLANRRMLEARLADFMRTDTPFVLAVADLDHFTQINNTYGHEFGDRALQLFAGVLEENVRDRDIVARFGGEEFVLVYPEMSVKPSMEAIERVRAALARSIARNDFPEFTCSFGVTHSSVGDSVESIIRIADAGLLTAKDLGRNRVVYADEDMAAEVFGGSDGVASSRAFSSMKSSADVDASVDVDLDLGAARPNQASQDADSVDSAMQGAATQDPETAATSDPG